MLEKERGAQRVEDGLGSRRELIIVVFVKLR